MKKLGKIHSYWIVVRSIISTLKCSLKIIWNGKNTPRANTDKLLSTWAQEILDIIEAKLTIHNPHHFTFKKGVRYIIMSNHTSLYDIPVILRSIDTSVRMIAKKELFRVPIWGRAMDTADFIEIDRGHSTKAIAALDLAKKKMSAGIVPWIAPEGTRSQDGRVGPFKKGGFMLAMQAEAIILPVNITGTFDVLPKKSLLFTKGVDVTVTIGKPVDASQYNKDSRDEFMTLVRSDIALEECPKEATPQ